MGKCRQKGKGCSIVPAATMSGLCGLKRKVKQSPGDSRTSLGWMGSSNDQTRIYDMGTCEGGVSAKTFGERQGRDGHVAISLNTLFESG